MAKSRLMQVEALISHSAKHTGIYHFHIVNSEHASAYVGETDQLARRMQHYRTPGPTQQTNIRLNKLYY